MAAIPEMKKLQHLFALFENARRLDVVKAAHEIEVFERRQFFIEIGPVRNIAEQCLCLVRLGIKIEWADENLAGCGFDDAGENPYQRGFSGAIAEKAEEFAFVNIEIDALQSGKITVALFISVNLIMTSFWFIVFDCFQAFLEG